LRGADLLSYFDGRAPIWRDILGTTIPRRDIVSTLREQLESQPHEKPTLILLSGASGEGKTTALLQIAADLVLGVNSWQVLWHHDTSAPFPTDLIASLPATGQWLIVSDDAELISNRLLDASRELSGAGRSNVHFLVCSRDTDWHASGADSMPWGSYTTMVRANLRGVSESDAMAIVGAWSSMGKEGLGSLAGVPIEIAAGHFAEAARSEAEAGHEGSLFGALLQVRRGTHLRDHVETLLLRLGDYRPARFDLQEAFSLIAALHAEDLLILTKEILAKALGVSVVDLRRKVLVPLGDEAAIATTGRHVFTRHRAIAVAAVELLADRFGVDLDAVYERLQAAALEVGLSGVFVPSFDKWRFLGGHFFLKGDPILGIRLGKMALAAEPGNPFLINKLSQMYRESGDSAAATQIYRQVSPTQPTRAYFLEWGLAEAGVGNQGVAARIIGYSLSDKCTLQPPDMDQAMMSLSSLNHVFSKLHERYGSDGYATASAAASELIRRIDQVRGRGSVVGSADSDDIHRLVQQLQGGILAGTAQEEYHPSSSSLPVAPTVMLAGLVRLVS
jgi:hypothetical protein